MDPDLITVERFADPATAGLAQSRLEAADIPSFLADEVTMGLAWHWNTAVGGIQLQVPPEHADEARLLLEDPGEPAAGDAESDPEPGAREQLARRSVRAGVMGWYLTPLVPYSLYLGIKSLKMPGELPGRLRTQLWLIIVVDFVLIRILGWITEEMGRH